MQRTDGATPMQRWLAIWLLVGVLANWAAPRSVLAAVALPKPVRNDGRDPTPRPDLVTVTSALPQPLHCAIDRPPQKWRASLPVSELRSALQHAFAKVVVRFDPPYQVRVVLKSARVDIRAGLAQVRMVVHVSDARDRSRQFQGPGDSEFELADLASEAELQQALLLAVDQAADHAALQFSARTGAPETTLTYHGIWLGGQVGGLGVLGVSALWPLSPKWLAQVAVNPLGPRLSASLGAGRRLHGDDEAELRGWVGLTGEVPHGFVSFCSASCQGNRVTRLYSAWLLEVAWQFGDGLGQRFGLQAGLIAGVELPVWNDAVNRLLSPWAGLGYWSSW